MEREKKKENKESFRVRKQMPDNSPKSLWLTINQIERGKSENFHGGDIIRYGYHQYFRIISGWLVQQASITRKKKGFRAFYHDAKKAINPI